MNLIKSNFEILDQEFGIEGIYKQIELAGRVSYKSEDKITKDSAKKFVDMLIKKGHTSVLEHGTVYLRSTYDISEIGSWRRSLGYKYDSNRYSEVVTGISADFRDIYITTNLRVLYENNWLNDLQYLCKPTEYHEKRVTVRFVLPISISREFCRHRTFSFMEQSTRYCNYNADKFNNELTFIIPYWANLKEAKYSYWGDDWVEKTDPDIFYPILKRYEGDAIDIFLTKCESAEANYKSLINKGLKAQEAREILPLCTKTELIMTGTVPQWEHFFSLRCNRAAHPQARELAIPLKEEFIKRGYC